MLRDVRFSNFFSFKDEQHIALTVGEKAPDTSDYFRSPAGGRIPKVIGMFGPNASGKTNFLRVLSFAKWFVCSSFGLRPEDSIPLEPFLFDGGTACAPTYIRIEYEADRHVYRYELEVTREYVLKENLFRRDLAPRSRFRYMFKRTRLEDSKGYEIVTQDFGWTKEMSGLIRPNASLISTAVQHNHEPSTTIRDRLRTFSTNVSLFGRRRGRQQVLEVSKFYHDKPELKTRAESILAGFDLGLMGFSIESKEIESPEGDGETVFIPTFSHKAGEGPGHQLPFIYESDGTQGLFGMLPSLLKALEEGGVAFIDEFEVDLHPHMIPELVKLFTSEATNPNNAQLIFSCHSSQIMSRLDKYQILLVEKDGDGASEIYRLDTAGARSDDNYFAKYNTGAYGAVPNL